MFGPLELFIVLAIVLLLFGARRLPTLGRDLGSGMREFKDGIMTPSADDEARSDVPAKVEPPDRRSDASPARESARS